MGFMKDFFKKGSAEKLLADAGCDLREIKKLFLHSYNYDKLEGDILAKKKKFYGIFLI